MKNQTAVEYLFQQLWDTPKDKFTWYAILKQAKQMEKDQIMNAWVHGAVGQNYGTAETYYNEIYETDRS